jgi:CCR4-NOT transcription complex subunit 6
LQCVQCLKAKLAQAKSLHCTAKCFAESWRQHVIMHQEAADKRENGVEEDDSPFSFNSNPAKALRALDGSLAGVATPPIPSSNGGSYSSPVRMASHTQSQDTGEVWCEVGQGKTYTPTAEDVGHILKLECVAIDGSTGRPLAAPHQTQTSRVIPAPSPTPRRLISVNPMDGLAAVETDGRTTTSGTFTVLSYNVLSDLYATSDLYSYCPPWALAWSYRRQNLLREIVGYHADILCLQEVVSSVHLKRQTTPYYHLLKEYDCCPYVTTGSKSICKYEDYD